MTRICKHCREEYMSRVGRGLCWACWRDKGIRDKYPPLAPFGGKEGSVIWAEQKKEHSRLREMRLRLQTADSTSAANDPEVVPGS